MAYVLALCSAVLYGAADFLGGLASRGASTVAAVVWTQTSGLLALVLLLPVLPEASASAADMSWGVAAGIAGSVGVALLYRALAIGRMAMVAPTTAVCAVVVPAVASVWLGERPSAGTLIGILVALVAIVLVSQQQTDEPSLDPRNDRVRRLPPGLDLALLSGVAIGFFFLFLAQTTASAGLWPLLTARGVSVVLFGAIALGRASLRLPARVVAIAIAGGVLDMFANAFYLLAVRGGPLTAVVTLSSLYPASTVVLARVVLRERFSGLQAVGIAAALVAVALIVS